jgi:type II secretory pathway component GspD/PulD (secretin)
MKRLFVLAIVSCLVSSGVAQQTRFLSLHLKKANVRDVLKRIASELDFRYEINKNVQGFVDVDATRKEFHEVLYAVLSQVDAIWMEQDGEFSFRPIHQPAKKRDSAMSVLPRTLVGEVDYVGSDIRLALKEQFGLQGVRYQIDPDVLGAITINLRNQTFETVVANMLLQVDAMWTFTKEGIRIMRRPLGDPGGTTGPPPPR